MKNFRPPPCGRLKFSVGSSSLPIQATQDQGEMRTIGNEGVLQVLRQCDLSTAEDFYDRQQETISPWPRQRQAELLNPRSCVNTCRRIKNNKSAPQLRQQLKGGIKASGLCITLMAYKILALPGKARKERPDGSHPTPSL